MRITDLRPGDRIMCCDVEHRVAHVANHPAGTVVITADEAMIPAKHLESSGWTLVPRRLTERVG